MNDDASLLRAYADNRSEAAFTELVHRYIDLVYAAALRRTGGDVHRAGDVAQQVFTSLAQHARPLARHTVLGAWLHAATRNAAFNLMISDQRRKIREGTALALAAHEATGPDWEQLRPLLDAAIDELPETDRVAVVLRFLEQRAFREIGAALGVSEDAARMRVDRALEKLRRVLGAPGCELDQRGAGAGVGPAGHGRCSRRAGYRDCRRSVKERRRGGERARDGGRSTFYEHEIHSHPRCDRGGRDCRDVL